MPRKYTRSASSIAAQRTLREADKVLMPRMTPERRAEILADRAVAAAEKKRDKEIDEYYRRQRAEEKAEKAKQKQPTWLVNWLAQNGG